MQSSFKTEAPLVTAKTSSPTSFKSRGLSSQILIWLSKLAQIMTFFFDRVHQIYARRGCPDKLA